MSATPVGPMFTARELQGTLRYDVDSTGAATAERVTWGRVKPILGLEQRPNPVPDDVFAIVFQLGILFYENPGLWAKSSTGVDSTDYTTVQQIDALLEQLRELVRDAGSGPSGGEAGVSSPRGGFPPPAGPYPDQAQPSARLGWYSGGNCW